MILMIITIACTIALGFSLLYPRKPIVDNTKLGFVAAPRQRPDADS